MSESQEQATVVQYFNAKWPEYKIFAVPNGTHIRSYAGRAKAKREGLLKGVSDLIIMVAIGSYHGLVIEMKDKGKTKRSLTPEQKAFLEYAHWQGWKAVWCAGADEAIKVIDEYMALEKSGYQQFVEACDWG